MILDGSFRCNGQRLGTMNQAPTKNYPCEPYGPPARRGDGRNMLRPKDTA